MKNSTTHSSQNALSALVPGGGQGKKQKLNGNAGRHFGEVMQRVNDQRPVPQAKPGLAKAAAAILKHRDENIEVFPLDNMKAVATAKHHDNEPEQHLPQPEEPDAGQQATSVPAPQPVVPAQIIAAVQELHQSFARPDAAAQQDHEQQQDQAPLPAHAASKAKELHSKLHPAEARLEPQAEAVAKTDKPVQQVEFALSQASAAARLEPAMPPAAVEQKVTLTLTKVETVLLPAATPAVMLPEAAKTVNDVAPAAPVLPTAVPSQTVVRTIHFQLQPDHLGAVKVGMHLKGEELRLTVEVSTREAHALLQRDTGLLRDALEKAGFDLAEQSVAITLKLDQPQLQQTSASSDGFSFTRGNNSEQTFHAASDGQNQRQHARQPGKDNNYAQTRSRTKEAEMDASGTGIYL